MCVCNGTGGITQNDVLVLRDRLKGAVTKPTNESSLLAPPITAMASQFYRYGRHNDPGFS